LLVICYQAFAAYRDLGPILWVLAVASMTVGNLGALKQTNIVRLLGYSSIAHGGFILVPFAMAASYDSVGLADAFFGSVTYLLVYAFMNLGAFALVIVGSAKAKSGEIADFAGMHRYAPMTAAARHVLGTVISLAGWFAGSSCSPCSACSMRSIALAATPGQCRHRFTTTPGSSRAYMDEVPIAVPCAEAAAVPTALSLVPDRHHRSSGDRGRLLSASPRLLRRSGAGVLS
jgi:hypothetical protein